MAFTYFFIFLAKLYKYSYTKISEYKGWVIVPSPPPSSNPPLLLLLLLITLTFTDLPSIYKINRIGFFLRPELMCDYKCVYKIHIIILDYFDLVILLFCTMCRRNCNIFIITHIVWNY